VLIGTISRINKLETFVYDFFQRIQYKAASDQIVLITADGQAESQKDVWSEIRFVEIASLFNSF
jgi:hypothetical protein